MADIWQQLLAGAAREDEKVPKKYLVICGEPRRGKKTLLDRFIADSDSSLAAFPYPSTSQHANTTQPRNNTRNAKTNVVTPAGPSFLTRNRAAYAANGGSSLLLSSIADAPSYQHTSKTSASANSTRRRDKGKEAEQAEDKPSASPSGHPLRLDVLDDKRLKSTEGILVGYEWVDISQPGETGKSPRILCGASLTIVCRSRAALIRVHHALE